jgi:hypothetical protein
MVQPMSCSNDDLTVERSVELDAPPEDVWDELLPSLFEGEDRFTVVEESVPAERLRMWWVPVGGDEPPSYVQLELEVTAVGTLLHVRETRVDGASLIRSAFSASAVAAR